MMQQQQQNKLSGFLERYTYTIIAISILGGFSVGYFSASYKQSITSSPISQTRVVQILIADGENTKTWNNVTLLEGDSVAKIITRVADIEKLQIAWNGSDKERTISSLLDKSSFNGTWEYYVNNATPLPTIGQFFPKNGDVLSLIYTNKEL